MPKKFIHSRQACTLDGSTEYVSMGDVLGFERTDSFSAWAWCKTTGTSDAIIGKLVSATAAGWGMITNAGGTISVILRNTGVTNDLLIASDDAWNDGEWHLFLFTYDGSSSASGAILYVDGIPVPTTIVNNTLTSTIAVAADFSIGSRDGTTNLFLGTIDESGVASKELSQAEVLELWNGGSPVDIKSTSFYAPHVLGGGGGWRGGDGSDTTTTWFDVTGKNNGTATGLAAANYVNDVPYRSYLNVLSMVLDGTDDTVSMGDATELKFAHNDAFSVSLWAKWTDATSEVFVSKADTGGVGRGWGLFAATSGALNLLLRNTNVGPDAVSVTTTATGFNDGAWHHIVITWDGTGSQAASNAHIYVDGSDEALSAGTDSLTGTIDNTIPFRIGARGTTASSFLQGGVCQASVFSKALAQAEVDELYDDGPVDVARTSMWPDCVGYWHLGACDVGTAGALTTALDQTPFGNNGTAAGSPVLALDVPAGGQNNFAGLAPDFDGTSQYLDVGDVAAWQFIHTDAFSLECWFRQPVTAVAGEDTIVGKADATTPFQGYRVTMDTGEDIIWELRNGSSNAIEIRTSTTIVDTKWHHLVCTYDGSTAASGAIIYIDGAVRPTTVVSDTLTATIAHAVALQWGAHDGANFFPGNVMGCAVYDVELTAAQVLNHFQTGPANLSTANASANLQGWWPLGHGDQGDATDACDYSTGMNHGTLSGTDAGYGQYDYLDAPTPTVSAQAGPKQDLVTEANTKGRRNQQVLGLGTYSGNRNLVIGAIPADAPSTVFGRNSSGPNANVGVPPGGGGDIVAETVFYTMRGRDDGVAAPGYVVWSVQDDPDYDGSEANAGNTSPPIVGSIIPGTTVVVNQT